MLLLARKFSSESFEFESQMAPPVIQWLRGQGLAIKQEFSLPWGVCDFVGARLDPVRMKLRLSYGQKSPIGPPLRIHILSKIPDHNSDTGITIQSLHHKYFHNLSTEFLEEELDYLIRMKFVVSPEPGLYRKLNGWDPLQVRIVAVELKLCKISEALAQASSNRAFATESYVALPYDVASRVAQDKRAAEFKEKGIGLLAVSTTSCCALLPGSEVPSASNEVMRAHCVERFWRTRDNSP